MPDDVQCYVGLLTRYIFDIHTTITANRQLGHALTKLKSKVVYFFRAMWH